MNVRLPPGRRVLLALLPGLLAAVAWWAGADVQAEAPGDASAVSGAASAVPWTVASATPDPALSAAVAMLPAASSPTRNDTLAAAACELAPEDDGQDAADEPPADRWFAVQREAGLQARLAARGNLLSSPQPLARAVGLRLLFSAFIDGEPADAAPEAGTPALLELLAMAREGRSPSLHALAWKACEQRAATDPLAAQACAEQPLQAWAALEADNAVPWLLLADRARRQGDADGEASAMAQAAGARRLRAEDGQLMAQVAAALPSDTPERIRLEIEVATLGLGRHAGATGAAAGLALLRRAVVAPGWPAPGALRRLGRPAAGPRHDPARSGHPGCASASAAACRPNA